MCKWGTSKEVTLCTPTPVQQRSVVLVDECIAPLVQLLNDHEVETSASCCGHGKAQGRIDLRDGNIIWLPRLWALGLIDWRKPVEERSEMEYRQEYLGNWEEVDHAETEGST